MLNLKLSEYVYSHDYLIICSIFFLSVIVFLDKKLNAAVRI